MKKMNKVEKTNTRVPFGHGARLPGWKDGQAFSTSPATQQAGLPRTQVTLGKAEQSETGGHSGWPGDMVQARLTVSAAPA